jgi:NADP-dependent aldehyde dehydrogenase
MQIFKDATEDDVQKALELSSNAFIIYSKWSGKQKQAFLHAIASEMENNSDALVSAAAEETHLALARLKSELGRTVYQLRSYGDACAEGSWREIRINTADAEMNPPRPDLRKMLVPLGPVVVFGASNFPFAYSTAGGDTACALAAGCSVVVKAHPAHAQTSELVAKVVRSVAKRSGLPEDVFQHIHGGFETGHALVMHPLTCAVGFTGSVEGGRALFGQAATRPSPIPVFAEMGSVNPVFLLPEKLKEDPEATGVKLAASVTQSAGQFCTNPGLLIGIRSRELELFKDALANEIRKTSPVLMLHPGIAKAFRQNREAAISQQGVTIDAVTDKDPGEELSVPTLAEVAAPVFVSNSQLHKEVFGPFTLLVVCNSLREMQEVAEVIEGQLTASIWATDREVKENVRLIDTLQRRCGRLVLNGVPTGVAVALAMHHGGPYPATTDSRFTAVGADGIKRFARPLCYQNWENDLLPDELKNENPLKLWRTVNDELNSDPIRKAP